LYGNRLTILREAMHGKLAGVVDLPESNAGTHIAAWLRSGLQADAIAAAAAARKIDTAPIRRFVLRAARPEGFLLGFAPYTPRQIRDGVDVLAAVIEQLVRRQKSTEPAAPKTR
jgi:GntR family transcriptional regulator/MocR family aminotransferase